MNERISMLNYWCVHDITVTKRILIIADQKLYENRREIESELSGVCASTTLLVPATASTEDFVKIAKLFSKQDGFHYDAVYFRPEFLWDKPNDYIGILKGLMRVYPKSHWILGGYGTQSADVCVKKAADELGLDVCDLDSVKSFMQGFECTGNYVSPKDEEAIGWMKWEIRSFGKNLPRILIIGDSIVWGAHEYFIDILSEYFDVTTFVSSMGVNGTRLYETVSELSKISGLNYDAVYFNNGLHTHNQTAEQYARNYQQTLDRLIGYFPKAVWILGLSTKVSDNTISGEQHETPISRQERLEYIRQNDLIIEYNKQVKEIAEQKKIELFDAYTLMADKDNWKRDCYHYNSEGKEFFARALSEKILKEYGIN